MLKDALIVDVNVNADRFIHLFPQIAWSHMDVFRQRGLVLYFTSKLPMIRDIAMDLDAGFGHYDVDKLFYAGNGLYEILFYSTEDRDVFLSTPTIQLKQ